MGERANGRNGEWGDVENGFYREAVLQNSPGLLALGKRLMHRALKGHQKLGRPIESTREALVHHFGRRFQGALPGIKPRAEALGYSV
jgi:hypothetical protein